MERVETTLQLSPPDPVIALLAVLIAVAALWQYFSLRSRTTAGLALVLTALRMSALGTLLFFVMEPSLLRQRKQHYRPGIAVAIDNSASMGLEDDEGTSRLDRVKEFVSSGTFRKVMDEYFPEYYSFSEGSEPVGAGAVETLEAVGRWTDIEEAIVSIQQEAPSSLGAVVLFTDGGHDDREMTGPVDGQGTRVPVIVVGVGEETVFQDVEIDGVRSAGMAFAGRPVSFTVPVRAQGFGGRQFALLLKENGRVVRSKEVVFEAGESLAQVEIAWTPPRPGRYHLTFEVPPQAGERIKENNRVDVTLEAARDKIRILFVSGRPGWTHRFLRDALKRDPSIDLVTFIILRSAMDAVNVPQDELSLIPFPTKKIFLEELPNFDLVIFDNFSYRFYFPAQYLEKVRAFVDDGGTFWMLGGPLSFLRGGYARSPLEEVLPVTLTALPQEKQYVPGPFRPVLTPAGKRHPFFSGLGDAETAKLPSLDGLNMSGPVREGSVTLVEHRLEEGASQPVMVLGRYGQGRTLAVLTDSIWKWNFEMVGRGEGNLFFLSLVRKAVRWSVGDPEMQPLAIRLEHDRVTPGKRVHGTIRVLGEDYLPAENPDLRVVIRERGGVARVLPVRRESEGVFSIETVVESPGTYEIQASVAGGGQMRAEDSVALQVAWPASEYRNPGLNRAALLSLGQRYPGATVELSTELETGRRLKEILGTAAPPYRIEFEEKKNLGESLPAFALIIMLLGAEWMVRKRQGMD